MLTPHRSRRYAANEWCVSRWSCPSRISPNAWPISSSARRPRCTISSRRRRCSTSETVRLSSGSVVLMRDPSGRAWGCWSGQRARASAHGISCSAIPIPGRSRGLPRQMQHLPDSIRSSARPTCCSRLQRVRSRGSGNLAAGMVALEVTVGGRSFGWRATKPSRLRGAAARGGRSEDVRALQGQCPRWVNR